MKVTRVAVVGAGPMGRLHARTLSRLAQARGDCALSGILDHHPERTQALARDLGARVFGDIEDLIRASDAAVVAVPAAGHREVAMALLDRGLDLLLEKPLAATLADGEAIVRRAHQSDRILQVGHVEWYNPAWREAARRVGTIQRIEVERSHPASGRGLDLDVVQDLMLHDLDWVSRLVGEEIPELRAWGRSAGGDRLDEAAAELRFRSGCTVGLRADRRAAVMRRRATFRGRGGGAVADLHARTLVSVDGRPLTSRGLVGVDPLEAQCSDFLDAVARHETPVNSGEVGLAALRLVDRVRAAIAAADPEAQRDDDLRLRG